MPRTTVNRNSVRRSGAVVESLADSPTGQQIDGNIILQGATFVAPNIFVVSGAGGPGTVLVDGADTTSGFLANKIANTSVILSPAGNESLIVTPYVGVSEVNDADTVAVDTTNLIVYTAITANRTITLPALSTLATGFLFTIKDISVNTGFTITIIPNGTNKIDGANSNYPIGSGIKASINLIKSSNSVGWIIA